MINKEALNQIELDQISFAIRAFENAIMMGITLQQGLEVLKNMERNRKS